MTDEPSRAVRRPLGARAPKGAELTPNGRATYRWGEGTKKPPFSALGLPNPRA